MASVVGGILLAGITLYAVFGGADFGGGLWDLLAGGDQRGWAPRRLIDESITPVWEANHVWLVFDLVIFWTAFPRAFAPVMTAAAVPLWIALAGVVLRGAGFAFRKEMTQFGLLRAAGVVFAVSSLLTPFFMGTVIGAIATGSVPADATQASLSAWTNATSLLLGFVFVAACAYLAAVYLTGEANRRGDLQLQAYFARRAQAAAIAAGALSLALLGELDSANPELYGRLTGRSLPFVVIAGVCGLVVIALLSGRWLRRREVRVIAATGVTAVIWGWGVAQYPLLLPNTNITVWNAGAPHAVFVALFVVFLAAVVLVGPSFAILFTLQSRQQLGNDEFGLSSAADPNNPTHPATPTPPP